MTGIDWMLLLGSLVVAGLAIGLTYGFFAGLKRGQEETARNWKQDVVNQGYAEWKVNQQTGDVAFVWKGEEPLPEEDD